MGAYALVLRAGGPIATFILYKMQISNENDQQIIELLSIDCC